MIAKDSEGYNEAEGYAASLRQMAKWVGEALNEGTPHHQRIDLGDIDTDELRDAAEYIERLSAKSVSAFKALDAAIHLINLYRSGADFYGDDLAADADASFSLALKVLADRPETKKGPQDTA